MIANPITCRGELIRSETHDIESTTGYRLFAALCTCCSRIRWYAVPPDLDTLTGQRCAEQ